MAEKIKFHEYLTILTEGGKSVVKCEKCDTVICESGSNWKENVPYTYREPAVWHRQAEKEIWNRYKEYYCPGCATLLEVNIVLPDDVGIEDEITLEALDVGQKGK